MSGLESKARKQIEKSTNSCKNDYNKNYDDKIIE